MPQSFNPRTKGLGFGFVLALCCHAFWRSPVLLLPAVFSCFIKKGWTSEPQISCLVPLQRSTGQLLNRKMDINKYLNIL